MRSHLTSATQRAKDIAFSTTHPPNQPQNDIFVPEHQPPSSHNINTSTLPPTVLTPSSHHAPMSYLNLLLLTFIFAVSLIFAIYFVFHTFLRGYAPSFEDVAPLYAKKLQKRRPPPLELVGGRGTDVEAQALRLVAVGGEQAGRVRSHSLGEGSSWWKEVMATGVEGEGEGLTPFSAARARARRYGEGDVEAKGTEGEDELGLGRYFFGDGVGIMRYESWGEARGWREG